LIHMIPTSRAKDFSIAFLSLFYLLY